METPAFTVDVCIAVHDPDRPIRRAVASVLNNTAVSTRVTVVAHNTDPHGVRTALGDFLTHPNVRVLSLTDSIRSAAGPFNTALDNAEATFTAVLGSDDSLEPYAIDEWVRIANRDAADVVIARLAHAGGAPIATPPTRPFRTRNLDGVRDRLSYRSAPLGLVRRSSFPDLRFAVGMPVGEDVSYVTALWFAGARISYARRRGTYFVHADAEQRTTHSSRPVAEELKFVVDLLGSARFESLSLSERASIATKLLRVHVFGVVHNRPDAAWWTKDQRIALAAIATQVLEVNGVAHVLSRNDHHLLTVIQRPDTPTRDLFEASEARRRFASLGSLLPPHALSIFAREAPLRYTAATFLQTIR